MVLQWSDFVWVYSYTRYPPQVCLPPKASTTPCCCSLPLWRCMSLEWSFSLRATAEFQLKNCQKTSHWGKYPCHDSWSQGTNIFTVYMNIPIGPIVPNNFGPDNTAIFSSLRVSKIYVFGNTIDMEVSSMSMGNTKQSGLIAMWEPHRIWRATEWSPFLSGKLSSFSYPVLTN